MSEPPRLYLITPPVADARAFAPRLEAALDAADVASVLLRVDPQAERDIRSVVAALAPLVQGRGAALLIEDDPRRAARLGADGVHVWGGGEWLDEALASLKPDRIVGIGGLRGRDDAMLAGERGVDYLMFGAPVASEPAEDDEAVLDVTAWWAEIFNVPCVAYVRDLDKASDFALAGAEFIAVGEDVWNDPAGALRAVSAALAVAAEETVA